MSRIYESDPKTVAAIIAAIDRAAERIARAIRPVYACPKCGGETEDLVETPTEKMCKLCYETK